MLDFLTKHESSPESYWSLVLEPGWVQAGIWQVKEGKASVISTSPETAWQEDEELVGAVDAALSACVQKLPDNFPEPNQTVFGVSSSWVKSGEISEEYLAKIKRICTELSLTPTGFVVLPEAIAHLFKSEEGTPLNAVVLGLGKDFLEISVFNLGNLTGTTQVARSVSLVDDVVEGLTRFGTGESLLPSRIIIFDGREGELGEAKDALSGANWEEAKGIKFLHTPKIETLDLDKKVLATSLAGASEIAQVSQVFTSQAKEGPALPPETTPTAETLGFTQVQPPQPKVAVSFKPGEYLQKAKTLVGGVGRKINFADRKKLIPLLVAVAVAFVGAFLFWWFYPKAEVAIYVAPKKFEEEFDTTFSGSLVSASLSGEKTKATTGKKLIGEKAKGVVSLRNGTDSAINFPAGMILISSGDLRFSLDKAASVSAAIDADNPGVAGADVTAVDIGAEYNLAKDEVFKIGNYPKADAYAKSTSDFSGGTSREISAVAKDDQQKLLDELTEELSEKAKKELLDKADSTQLFINDLVSLETLEEDFDKKVGDEADTLKLSLKIEAKAILADKQKLAEFVRERLKDQIPQGFVLRDSQIDYKFNFSNEESGVYTFATGVTANFLPEVKTDEIIKKISGRTPQVVEQYLASVPGFTRAEIKLKPHFPGRFGTLPRVPKNITIEVVAER